MPIKHAYVSFGGDSPTDPNAIGQTRWNETHDLSGLIADDVTDFVGAAQSANSAALALKADKSSLGYIINTTSGLFINHLGSTNGSANTSSGTIYYAPVVYGTRGIVIQNMQVRIQTPGSGTPGTNAIMGIYDEVNGLPTNLIAQTSQFSFVTSGVKTVAISCALPPNRCWAAILIDAQGTMPQTNNCSNPLAFYAMGAGGQLSSASQGRISTGATFPTLPSTAPSTSGNSVVPAISLQVA